MAARRFLYVIAGLIMLSVAAAIGWNIFQDQILRATFVPANPFMEPPSESAPDYKRANAWLSRPDLPDDPAGWVPNEYKPADRPAVAVFYVSPTTYLRRDRWNAPYDDRESGERQRLFAMSQASAFNSVGAIWAPRYRQAVLGAFLRNSADAQKALDFAYFDVERAFEAFLASIPASRPILLVGHSQGSLHLIHLMQRRIAGTPVARRIVAAYIVGWPISIAHDLPEMGLAACETPGQANCILSWQSFAEPSDPHQIMDIYNNSTGLDGKPRRDTPMLCVNPLTGAANSSALPSANKGALMPHASFQGAKVKSRTIGARCTPQGFLSVGMPPIGYGAYVLPGNNYHVFDYAMFWANIRSDAETRTKTFMGK